MTNTMIWFFFIVNGIMHDAWFDFIPKEHPFLLQIYDYLLLQLLFLWMSSWRLDQFYETVAKCWLWLLCRCKKVIVFFDRLGLSLCEVNPIVVLATFHIFYIRLCARHPFSPKKITFNFLVLFNSKKFTFNFLALSKSKKFTFNLNAKFLKKVSKKSAFFKQSTFEFYHSPGLA